MKKESQFLKKRAEEFWARSAEDFDKKRYNLAALDVEQAVQLWIKYLIFLKAGDFPKSHYLDSLVQTLSQVYDSGKITKFFRKNILQFKSLEDAYLTSRYFPKEFTQEEAKKMIAFARKFFQVLKDETKKEFV